MRARRAGPSALLAAWVDRYDNGALLLALALHLALAALLFGVGRIAAAPPPPLVATLVLEAPDPAGPDAPGAPEPAAPPAPPVAPDAVPAAPEAAPPEAPERPPAEAAPPDRPAAEGPPGGGPLGDDAAEGGAAAPAPSGALGALRAEPVADEEAFALMAVERLARPLEALPAFGRIDRIAFAEGGEGTVAVIEGWARFAGRDPRQRLLVRGPAAGAFAAEQIGRPDVAAAMGPGLGAAGFRLTVPVPAGAEPAAFVRRLCLVADDPRHGLTAVGNGFARFACGEAAPRLAGGAPPARRAGAVDSVSVRPQADGTALVTLTGWGLLGPDAGPEALALRSRHPVAFARWRRVLRPDVAAATGDPRLEAAGFELLVGLAAPAPAAPPLCLAAEDPDFGPAAIGGPGC
ncbi:MAG TPA: hypothetical protein VEH84_11350 [Alphaproteobacteria bacterium]|nr:hypothetical protein [Alphaproteobacteria bacterium]